MDPAQNIDYKSFNLDQFTIVQHQTSCSNNIQKPIFKFRHAQNAPTISLEQKDDKYSLLGSYVHVSNNHSDFKRIELSNKYVFHTPSLWDPFEFQLGSSKLAWLWQSNLKWINYHAGFESSNFAVFDNKLQY